MSTELTFSAYGTSFALRASGRSLLTAAARRARQLGWRSSKAEGVDVGYSLRRQQSARDEAQGGFELWCGDELIRRASSAKSLLDSFENHAKLETAYRAEGCLFVHAGVVAWNGRGILLPGKSRTGKTTLVEALLRAGAVYYSDEFAVIGTAGRLHPYPLPLSIREGNGSHPRSIDASELGASMGTTSIPLALIIATEYHRGARWRPRFLTKGEALLALMQNTVAARRPPELTMPLLRRAVAGARAIQTARGDAGTVVPRILAELG